jgi:NitT/TauT family transport system substrate-binding protein
MTKTWTRRSVIRVAALAGAALPLGKARAQAKEGRVIYPVAVAIYQAQFVADRLGFFKDAGLDCKLIQGGSGVKTRELVASGQGDIGIGDITHPMQLANRGRKGRVLMPVDTRNNGVVFIIRKDLGDEGISRCRSSRPGSGRTGASRSSACRRSAARTTSGPPTTWSSSASTRP